MRTAAETRSSSDQVPELVPFPVFLPTGVLPCVGLAGERCLGCLHRHAQSSSPARALRARLRLQRHQRFSQVPPKLLARFAGKEKTATRVSLFSSEKRAPRGNHRTLMMHIAVLPRDLRLAQPLTPLSPHCHAHHLAAIGIFLRLVYISFGGGLFCRQSAFSSSRKCFVGDSTDEPIGVGPRPQILDPMSQNQGNS